MVGHRLIEPPPLVVPPALSSSALAMDTCVTMLLIRPLRRAATTAGSFSIPYGMAMSWATELVGGQPSLILAGAPFTWWFALEQSSRQRGARDQAMDESTPECGQRRGLFAFTVGEAKHLLDACHLSCADAHKPLG